MGLLLGSKVAPIWSIIVFLGLSFAQVDYIGWKCDYDKGNYTLPTSPFHSNLVAAFSNLTVAATVAKFHNATGGSGGDKVYALYECRGDLAASTCQICVENATATLPQICVTKEAIIIYEDCTLRYANRLIFSKMEVFPRYLDYSRGIVPDDGVLNRTVLMELTRLIAESTATMDYFAVGVEPYLEYQKVYCLVQCTPDIKPEECRECLMEAWNETGEMASNGRWWVTYVGPSCQMRYDLTPFLNFSSPPSAAPLPPALSLVPSHSPPTNEGSRARRRPSSKLNMAIISSVSILLYFGFDYIIR